MISPMVGGILRFDSTIRIAMTRLFFLGANVARGNVATCLWQTRGRRVADVAKRVADVAALERKRILIFLELDSTSAV